MNERIDSLKIKLIAAVDLNQKKINKITDIKEALKELESFPMTLDILNSSRIGKIVNDIRHFNDAQSDIKTRLKDLIKQWNDKLLPHRNKKPTKISKPSNSNGCSKPSKVSEPPPNTNTNNNNNISHYHNENYKEKHLLSFSKPKSSNNLETLNGKTKNIKDDCDNSFDIPNKKQRIDSKIAYSESPKTLFKEIHLDIDYKPNNFDLFSQKHDSPAALHFSDAKRFIKKEEPHSNVSPSITTTTTNNSKEKHRKRKYDLSFNGITATPLQKVKSTRELLAEMGDVVGSDTKKKILCNEIAFEDDIPKSCIPESVRPKPKPVKHMKNTAQNLELSIGKPSKYSPKAPPINDDDLIDFALSNHRSNSELSSSSLASNRLTSNPPPQSYNHHHNGSPPRDGTVTKRSSSPASDITNHAQSIATPTLSDDLEKCSLKIKIPLKPYKKKSKHHDPPVTNRMDDLPLLPDIDSCLLSAVSSHHHHDDDADADDVDALQSAGIDIVQLFARSNWVGRNCTRHPISGELFGFCDLYKVEHLCVLAWADKAYECPSFFPVDTARELAGLEAAVGEFS